jgi:uncharacterized protein (DUF433 family)
MRSREHHSFDCRLPVLRIHAGIDCEEMKMWQAQIFLMASRRGIPEESIPDLYPMHEADIKKIMRSIGMTHEEIEAEYPEYALNHVMDIMRADPDMYDRMIIEGAQHVCSRN